MTKTFKPGDKVVWDTSQGETRGRVVNKQTSPTRIKRTRLPPRKIILSTSSRATSQANAPRTNLRNCASAELGRFLRA
jgi:hypothetical protein